MSFTEIKLKTILKEIRAKENGPAVDAMENMGMKYNKNFGVSLFDLKIIAKKYHPNSKLANTLRNKNIRETRILAEMIEDVNSVTESEADSIVNNINTIELAEQTSINLLEKLTFADKKVIEWINSENDFVVTTGFILLSRIALINKEKQDDYFISFLNTAIICSDKESIFVRKSVARALRQTALRNDSLKKAVLDCCETISKKESQLAKLVVEEVVPLINF